jgi:ribosome assembly protein YihI (activator of Der GTPase)
MKIERIKDVDSAKSMAYAKQLWTENEISKELERLRHGNKMSFEEWRFVDGCLVAASGNLLTSVVIARYGGENARIEL